MMMMASDVTMNLFRIVLGVANRVLGLQRHQARWSVN